MIHRESAFGLCQYANSVIVLDEIQNYRIEIWNEIIISTRRKLKFNAVLLLPLPVGASK